MSQIQRLAVIDLGTNTFHLLIVDLKPNGFEEVYRERCFIKLAEGGIDAISPSAFDRALDAMIAFRRILDDQGVTIIKAFGTAALRTASNGLTLVQAIFESTKIEIELISGLREANLIYKGVAQVVPFVEAVDLLMDIGGGSVEFILANNTGVLWAESFPIGVAVLYDKFHRADPISTSEIKAMEAYLEITLANLWTKAAAYKPVKLIGASGTFDVLENIFAPDHSGSNYSLIDVGPFYPFVEKLINATLAERLLIEGVPEKRADMIVVAVLLIRVVISRLAIEQIVISSYAMKEGMISEFFLGR